VSYNEVQHTALFSQRKHKLYLKFLTSLVHGIQHGSPNEPSQYKTVLHIILHLVTNWNANIDKKKGAFTASCVLH
jgi:hypothetical protein